MIAGRGVKRRIPKRGAIYVEYVPLIFIVFAAAVGIIAKPKPQVGRSGSRCFPEGVINRLLIVAAIAKVSQYPQPDGGRSTGGSFEVTVRARRQPDFLKANGVGIARIRR